MIKIKNNYHAHTFRCGHAQIDEKELAKKAYEKGMTELGFSDHVFLPNLSQPGVRGDYSLLDEYCESINALKIEYKDKMNIYLGFEAEYLEPYEEYYSNLLRSHKIDYLILGQHGYWENNQFMWCSNPYKKDDEELVNIYKEKVIKAIKTGLFSYIAHPDYFFYNLKEMSPFAKQVAYEIALAAKENDVPLEINLHTLTCPSMTKSFNGVLRLPYPYEPFWEIVGEVGAKVVIGIDIHANDELDKYDASKAFEWIKKYNLNYVSKLDFKKF